MTNTINSNASPSAFVQQTSTITNVTGDGTLYPAVFNNVVSGGNFNIFTGVFTCTVPGTFMFSVVPCTNNLTAAATSGVYTLVTTLATYTFASFNTGSWRNASNQNGFSGFVIANMNLNDTANVNLQISNTTKTIGFGVSISFISIWRLF